MYYAIEKLAWMYMYENQLRETDQMESNLNVLNHSAERCRANNEAIIVEQIVIEQVVVEEVI